MTHQPTAPDGHELMLRVVPMPADLNGNGDVFGGWVMAQVDIAGGLAAAAATRRRSATWRLPRATAASAAPAGLRDGRRRAAGHAAGRR